MVNSKRRCLQRLRAHSDVFGGVGDRDVAHQLRQSPGIHAAIGLHRAGSVPQTVRMDRPGDLGLNSCRFNHLVDGKPREGFPALAGEDMRSLGLLLALQSLQAIGLIAFEIMGSINAALEASDGDGAFPPINIVPAKVDELADPKPVQERHQSDHMVAVAMPIALQRRKQPVEFILGERLALAEACLV